MNSVSLGMTKLERIFRYLSTNDLPFPFILLILQNIQSPSSDESLLIPQHNYKLDAHALNIRHPGEVWQHTSSILNALIT